MRRERSEVRKPAGSVDKSSQASLDETTGLSGLPLVAGDASAALAVIWVTPGPEMTVTRLTGSRLLLGRAPECDVSLSVSGVSRRHAVLRPDGPIWLLEDASSTNGTFLDRRRVERGPLAPGSVIRLGEAVGVVVSGTAARVPAAFSHLADGLYGGAAFAEQLADATRVARSNLCTVVQGETGSGKEQVARALHAWSGRSGPLVTVNCAGLPENLLESELFGYRRGAFTGADHHHLGYLRSADGGTLFLDEVIELPLSSQAKLLRALETREVVPLGETKPVAIDVRLISATQRPLEICVEEGGFRADLMARLNEYRIALPPLRARREDVPGLFGRFLSEACGGSAPPLDAKAVEALCAHDWPLNVRELRNVARRTAVLHSHRETLRCEHLPPEITAGLARVQNSEPGSEPAVTSRDHAELERLVEALGRTNGRLGLAAEEAGISRQRAQRLLQRFPERDPRRQS
jgi:DNA-binding NtrC family response regulator